MIWAMTRNRVIGAAGGLPWRLPDEMRHFMRTTLGKPVIMGRRTFETMAEPLPKRTNIVLTRAAGFRAEGAEVVTTLDAALECARRVCLRDGVDECLIIGGADLYALGLPLADRLYETVIDVMLEGDTFFPEYDAAAWEEVEAAVHPPDARHAYGYTTRILERRP
jgi:dihydrofolate reductase